MILRRRTEEMPLPVRVRHPSVNALRSTLPRSKWALGMRRNDSTIYLREDRFALILARTLFRVKGLGSHRAGFAIYVRAALRIAFWSGLGALRRGALW